MAQILVVPMSRPTTISPPFCLAMCNRSFHFWRATRAPGRSWTATQPGRTRFSRWIAAAATPRAAGARQAREEPSELTLGAAASERPPDAVGGEQLEARLVEVDLRQAWDGRRTGGMRRPPPAPPGSGRRFRPVLGRPFAGDAGEQREVKAVGTGDALEGAPLRVDHVEVTEGGQGHRLALLHPDHQRVGQRAGDLRRRTQGWWAIASSPPSPGRGTRGSSRCRRWPAGAARAR